MFGVFSKRRRKADREKLQAKRLKSGLVYYEDAEWLAFTFSVAAGVFAISFFVMGADLVDHLRSYFAGNGVGDAYAFTFSAIAFTFNTAVGAYCVRLGIRLSRRMRAEALPTDDTGRPADWQNGS